MRQPVETLFHFLVHAYSRGGADNEKSNQVTMNPFQENEFSSAVDHCAP